MSKSKFKTSLLLILFLFVHSSVQVILHCEFDVKSLSYYCDAQNLTTTFQDRHVTDVTGDHKKEYSNEKVERALIFHQNCEFIPRDLNKFFPNLTNLAIVKSNLQFLMSGDLDGLDKLKVFDVTNNPIDQIGQDFFAGHSSITSIIFNLCSIKKVDFGAFNDLKSLETAEFNYNECINALLGDEDKEKFFSKVYTRCHGRGNAVKTINFRECKLSQTGTSNLNYILFPLAVLSSCLTTLLGMIMLKIQKRKDVKVEEFNEIANDNFDNSD